MNAGLMQSWSVAHLPLPVLVSYSVELSYVRYGTRLLHCVSV